MKLHILTCLKRKDCRIYYLNYRGQNDFEHEPKEAYFRKIHIDGRLIIRLRWLIMSRKVYFCSRGLRNRVDGRATETVLKRVTWTNVGTPRVREHLSLALYIGFFEISWNLHLHIYISHTHTIHIHIIDA